MKTELRPAPPPLEANDVAIVTGGTVLWLVGFLALLPFHHTLAEHGRAWWQWTCLAGFGLGLIGIWYTRARRAAIRRARAGQDAPDTPSAGTNAFRAEDGSRAEPRASQPGAGASPAGAYPEPE